MGLFFAGEDWPKGPSAGDTVRRVRRDFVRLVEAVGQIDAQVRDDQERIRVLQEQWDGRHAGQRQSLDERMEHLETRMDLLASRLLRVLERRRWWRWGAR